MRNFENCKNAKSLRLNPAESIAEIINKAAQVIVYPNPSNGFLNIKSSFLIKEITVTAIDGKRLFMQNPHNSQTTINLSILEKGIYFVNLVGNNNQSEVKKVILN
jgi:hypothetical protein